MSGVSKKKSAEVREDVHGATKVKREDSADEKSIAAVPDVDASLTNVQQEESASTPAVVFKKRKVKR